MDPPNAAGSSAPNSEEGKPKDLDDISPNKDLKEKLNLSSHYLNLLELITEIHGARTDIKMPEASYGTLGHDIVPWMPKIITQAHSRLRVLTIGNQKKTYILNDPIIKIGNFNDIDGLIDEHLALIPPMVDRLLEFISEPRETSMLGERIAEPDILGIPFAEICRGNVSEASIKRALLPRLTIKPGENIHFSKVDVPGLELSGLQSQLIEYMRIIMPRIRHSYENWSRHIRRFAPPEKELLHLSSCVILGAYPNPFKNNLMLRHIPWREHFSHGMLMELLTPEVSLEPVQASELLVLSAQTTNRLSSVHAFINITFSDYMNKEIAYIIYSLICPGSVEITINFDEDLGSNDVYLRAFGALIAKTMLPYSAKRRWNAISKRSVKICEDQIAAAGLEAGILGSRPAGGGTFPLDRVEPREKFVSRGLASLRTTASGLGWRESGEEKYGATPPDCPYPMCSNRPLYVTREDDKTRVDESSLPALATEWKTREAVSDFIGVLFSL